MKKFINNKVYVAVHPETGAVITPSTNKPEFGTIRLDSQCVVVSRGGFLDIQKRSAFIRGRVEILESLGLKDHQMMQGKIIREESFEPFWDGQEPKINPTTQEIVLLDDKPVYMQHVYTEDMTQTDRFINSQADKEEEQGSEEPIKAEGAPQGDQTL